MPAALEAPPSIPSWRSRREPRNTSWTEPPLTLLGRHNSDERRGTGCKPTITLCTSPVALPRKWFTAAATHSKRKSRSATRRSEGNTPHACRATPLDAAMATRGSPDEESARSCPIGLKSSRATTCCRSCSAYGARSALPCMSDSRLVVTPLRSLPQHSASGRRMDS